MNVSKDISWSGNFNYSALVEEKGSGKLAKLFDEMQSLLELGFWNILSNPVLCVADLRVCKKSKFAISLLIGMDLVG